MPESLDDAIFNSTNHTIELITTIRLKWNSPTGVDRVCVLVEGSGDCNIYDEFFNHRSAWLEYTWGKGPLKIILEALNGETKQLIGIQDADFSHLENKQPEIDTLFFTDCHDIEMTMFKAEGILEAIFSILGKGNDMGNIWGTVIENASYIGYIRWYNDQSASKLVFDKIFNYYDTNDILNEKPKIIQALNNQSTHKKQELKYADIENFITNHRTDDTYNLCNGHDVIKLLTKTWFHGANMNRTLKSLYQNYHFIGTKLYHDIALWQQKFGHSIVSDRIGA
jgi:hypothetical protein